MMCFSRFALLPSAGHRKIASRLMRMQAIFLVMGMLGGSALADLMHATHE